MMTVLEIGPTTVLRIPNAWTAFTYRGFLYGRDPGGRWMCMAKVGDENNSVLREKRA